MFIIIIISITHETIDKKLNRNIYIHCRISKDHPKIKHKLTTKYWDLAHGYSKTTDDDEASLSEIAYPFRVSDAGVSAGLALRLITPIDEIDENICRDYVTGFKMLLHSPFEVPQMSKYYIRVPMENEMTVAIKPNIINANSNIQKYGPEM